MNFILHQCKVIRGSIILLNIKRRL